MKSKNHMKISIWVEPKSTIEDYKFAKDMGVTHVFAGDSCFADAKAGTEGFFAVLRLCESAGLRAIVRTMNTFPLTDTTDYKQFPAVEGINYWDEPFHSDFSKLEELLDRHMSEHGDKLSFFINMNPNETAPGWHPWGDNISYEEYIDEFCRRILNKIDGERILSCDVYPIVVRNGQRIIKDTWLPCVEVIATLAKKYGLDTNFFVQSASFSNSADYYVYPDDAGLRFQFFAEMAFGIRNFTYFTYADYGNESSGEWFTKALVRNDISCSPNPLYYIAKQLNAELKHMESTYLSYTWEGVMPVSGGESVTKANVHFDGLKAPLRQVAGVKSVVGRYDALVGSFSCGGGRALMVSNFSDPADGLTNTVRIEFDRTQAVIMYAYGNKTTLNLHNGVLDIELKPGQGMFIEY